MFSFQLAAYLFIADIYCEMLKNKHATVSKVKRERKILSEKNKKIYCIKIQSIIQCSSFDNLARPHGGFKPQKNRIIY